MAAGHRIPEPFVPLKLCRGGIFEPLETRTGWEPWGMCCLVWWRSNCCWSRTSTWQFCTVNWKRSRRAAAVIASIDEPKRLSVVASPLEVERPRKSSQPPRAKQRGSKKLPLAAPGRTANR